MYNSMLEIVFPFSVLLIVSSNFAYAFVLDPVLQQSSILTLIPLAKGTSISTREMHLLFAESNDSEGERIKQQSEMPVCDLQTLLRLTECLGTGGSAKLAIQSGSCQLNGSVETRRAKKLFTGDVVSFQNVDYNVDQVVAERNYVYKPKQKKVKPQVKVDKNGNKEFGGLFRSEEWRAERKEKKKRKFLNPSERKVDTEGIDHER